MADLGAGLAVGMVALPLAMAFAIASGLTPAAGLVTAIVGGFLISALGGSQVQIGGPAGAFIVVVYAIVERYGVAQLLLSTLMAGVLLLLMGWLRLGIWVRYVPVTVVTGFTNGIAVLIALSQVRDLLGLTIDKLSADFFTQVGTLAANVHTWNPASVALGLCSLAVVAAWPKSYAVAAQAHSRRERAYRLAARVPGTVVVLIGATVLTHLLAWPVATIGERFGSIPAGLPAPAWPEFNWTLAKQLVGPTLTLALLGAIESLLCARVADNLTEFKRHDPNQELMAQGIANIAAPLFGGLPATGTVARTVTNVRSGARSPVAGMAHALVLLLIVWVAAPWAALIPLSALAGLLLFVAWNMGEWRELVRARRFAWDYQAKLYGTFVLTVVFDLTVAVQVGLLLACVFFIVRMGTLFQARPISTDALPSGVAAYSLYGSLFFGATPQMEALADSLPAGTRAVVLDMQRLVLLDTSGLQALEMLHRQLQRQAIALVLAEVNEQPLELMRRSGFEAALGAEHIVAQLKSALHPTLGSTASGSPP